MMARNLPRIGVTVLALSLVFALQGIAQDTMNMPKGIQGSFLKQSNMVEQQFLSLAEAIPQEKYTWRPATGVRSISEAFLHCARGNYAMLPFLGGKVPDGIDPVALETSTSDKKAVIAAIKTSFKAINDHIGSVPDSDLERNVKVFRMEMTVGDAIMLCATHQHELLGQAIAYARMNNVVPPWTAEREAKMKEQEKN